MSRTRSRAPRCRQRRRQADFALQPLERRQLLAAAYYVSPTGNDANDGRSPQTAWQTIARANGRNWNPGDALLFEGGQTFNVTGAAGLNVLINSSFDAGLGGWPDTLDTAETATTINPTAGRDGGAVLQIAGEAGSRAQDVTQSLAGNQAYKLAFHTLVENPGNGLRRIGITFEVGGQKVATYYRGFQNTDWDETKFAFVTPAAFDRAYVWITRAGDNSTVYADDITLNSLPNGIVLDPNDSGSIPYPLIISSYGPGGNATINAGDGIGFWGHNVAAVQIERLNFAGTWHSPTGTGGNVGAGIEFVNTRNDNSKLEHIVVHKADINGFMWAGIRIGGAAAKSGFRGVLLTDNTVRGNGDVGIHIRGEFDKNSNKYSNEKVWIARSRVYSNSGIPDRNATSGNGILVSDVRMATVERTVANNNGALSDFNNAGPIGIFAFDAKQVIFHYNESYSNKTGSSRDGAGFDFDSGVSASFMQNNYSHDNDGAGFLVGQFHNQRPWGGNVIRNNISQNDARKNAYGAITLTGPPGPTDVIIEHNTIYTTAVSGATPSGVRLKYAGPGVQVRNNIIYTTGGVSAVDVDSRAVAATFHGNVYFNPTLVKIRWNGVIHNSLESWRAASGREMIGINPTGMIADPQLVAPGAGGTLGFRKLHELSQYRLLPTSPLINQAVAPGGEYVGYFPERVDYFVKDVTEEVRDVGAAEFA